MPPRKTSNRYASLILIVLLLIALFVVKQCFQSGEKATRIERTTKKSSNKTPTEARPGRGLNRNPSAINYSKHARCRMDCRHISEAEVKQVLKEGAINYRKSEIGELPDCKKKYAVEGQTNDGQRVRIIFAPCATEVTVVTVIDLGKEWECECQ